MDKNSILVWLIPMLCGAILGVVVQNKNCKVDICGDRFIQTKECKIPKFCVMYSDPKFMAECIKTYAICED